MSDWIELPWPSINGLTGYLYKLARSTVKYWLGVGEYGDVQKYQLYIYNWFQALWYKIRNVAEDEANEAQSFLVGLVATVNSVIGTVKKTADDAALWITVSGKLLKAWYSVNGAKTAYLISNGYAWLKQLWSYPTSTIYSLLGSAWAWVRAFYANKYTTIATILGDTWKYLVWFYGNKVAAIQLILGAAWLWVKWFFENKLAAIELILGAIWLWLKSFYTDPLGVIDALTGNWLTFSLALARIYSADELQAARDNLKFWYNLWAVYRNLLVAFLSDPVGFILAVVRDVFLAWFEDLVEENW